MQSKYCRPSSTRPESQKGDINGLVATTIHGISRTPNIVDAFCWTYGGHSLYFTLAYMSTTAHPTKTFYWNPPLTTSAWNSPPYPRAARNAHARKTLNKVLCTRLTVANFICWKSFNTFLRCPFCAYPTIFLFGGTKFRSFSIFKSSTASSTSPFCDFLQACNSRKPSFTWVSCEIASGVRQNIYYGHILPSSYSTSTHLVQAFSQTPSVPQWQT